MADLPPALPTEFQIYNTYALDPPWQVHYTLAWAGAVVLVTLLSLHRLTWNIRHGIFWQSIRGVSFDYQKVEYEPLVEKENPGVQSSMPVKPSLPRRAWNVCERALLWSLPGFGLHLGQLLILVAYLVILTFCIVYKAPLRDNPNRAGFMTVAQLPFVFLFATKNSVLTIFWQRGYERLNFLHRWAGRGMFLSATVHGGYWIANHLQYHVPILGAEKERLGVITYAFLGILVITSLKPVRRVAYEVFFYIHVIAFVSFFVVMNYHTPFAVPWIFPSIAFYGFDILLRLLRYRIKQARLVASDNQMTILHIDDCDEGWVAGQHVRVRLLASGRVFESHPLTIANAPSSNSCSSGHTMVLGARAVGDWTRALNRIAREGQLLQTDKENSLKAIEVMVMLDGPYGGSMIDLGKYETVLLVAGGSGITFILALLDDIVGRVVRLGRSQREITRKIEFVWSISSYGNMFWFSSMLAEIAELAQRSPSIEIHISVFVTCLCDPEALPLIANSRVIEQERPSVRKLMATLLKAGGQDMGGLGLAVSGPESMAREARNAVATLGRKVRGEIGIHTEVFSL